MHKFTKMARKLTLTACAGISVIFGTLVSAARADGPSGPLTLTDCVGVGLDNQPAIAAAQASLRAAQTGGVDNLSFLAVLLSPDLPIRKNQAALGVDIAAAAVDLAEWETRYAITRNYFSVIYAHEQTKVVNDVLENLRSNRKQAEDFVKLGIPPDPKKKQKDVTQNDVDNLTIYIELYEAKKIEAVEGMRKAGAALREAMGVDCHFDLNLLEEPLPDPVSGIDCKEVIAMALDRRGEMMQATLAEQVTSLEVQAQRRLFFKIQTKTFAAGADVHSRPIPQGIANHEYRPYAIGLEMPVFMIGKRLDRVDRTAELNARAGAVVEKTTNLVWLDAEAAFSKWQEAVGRIGHLAKARPLAKKVADLEAKRFNDKAVAVDDLIRSRTLEEQLRAQYNEALYQHALALAGLERVTAGGLRPTYAGTRLFEEKK